MARKRMKKPKDKRVFSHTAVIGRKVNVQPSHGRGGQRI